MSRRSRQTRAAKNKDRRRAAGQRERTRSDPGPDGTQLLDRLVVALSEAATRPGHQAVSQVGQLLDECRNSLRYLDIAVDIAVAEAIRAAWEHGWSPSDLHEIARRRVEPSLVGYLEQAIVLEARRYTATSLHPRWRFDLAAISARVGHTAEPPQMCRWAAANGVDRREALTIVVTLLNFLGKLPALEVLLPLPGSYREIPTAAAEVDDKYLTRVRALLAKAEATEFPDEAEAFSAKAQELMSRYSLHEAVAQHDRGRAARAAARRIWIDNPYAAAKVSLVQAVGKANSCRTVWAQRLGFVTVVGSDINLDLSSCSPPRCWFRPTDRCLPRAGSTAASGHARDPFANRSSSPTPSASANDSTPPAPRSSPRSPGTRDYYPCWQPPAGPPTPSPTACFRRRCLAR